MRSSSMTRHARASWPATRVACLVWTWPRLLVAMDSRISLVTLGVSDYGRAKAFYEALGWSPTLDIEETAYFQANGSILVLWARDKLAEDMGIPDEGARWSGIALAHEVGSREKVHEIIEQAR